MPPKFYSAVHYDGSVCHTEGGDGLVLRKLKINCPICKREFSALLSKFIKFERVSNTVSEEEPNAIYTTKCIKCGSEFRFGVDWS